MTGHAGSHGATVPRGLDAPDAGGTGRGRFGRMFAELPSRELSTAAIDKLYDRIFATSTGAIPPVNESVPAGYTHLGQFIDHDLTFDPMSQLGKDNDPLALQNFRTPRFDLDSLYGSGPRDQPFLYEFHTKFERVKLLVGRSPGSQDGETIDDLPRNHQGRALIGDARNDEHLILAQLHLLFAQFHNTVVEKVSKTGLKDAELLREAQRIVRWHYQWIVVHDFLRKVAGTGTAWRVLSPGDEGPTVNLRHFRPETGPYIPVEFSGAAYRFGHSMVRQGYRLNAAMTGERPIFEHSSVPTHLGGFRALPADSVIDWSFFFRIPGHQPPQLSHRIDPLISARLFSLPKDVGLDGVRELPRLNLLRSRALGLPAGPDVARLMGETPLTDAQLGIADVQPDHIREELGRGCPLWYYVLSEAQALEDGRHLGPVGAAIVAEVLVGLLAADPSSYLCQWPTWTPELGHGDDFTMTDLVQFVHPEDVDA
ncbi:MAG TPA: heme peroxidase family protein [Solirubrobacteraceae bacterium]|nr:heme peroxidase family protein [Solirubrobacteraceae bacterium]